MFGLMKGFRAVAGLSILFVVTSVQAATVYNVDVGNSSISAHTSGPGLLIGSSIIVPEGYSFSLDGVGDSHTFAFFRIWTNEDWVNVGEDTVAKPITATLAFSIPLASGTVDGSTVGLSVGVGGFYQAGKVTWNGPTIVDASSGQFQISLSDEVFNEGAFWSGPGCRGATVQATVSQISVVPLPTAAASGLLVFGLAAIRRALGRK